MSKELFRLSAIVLALCLTFGGSALAQSDEFADEVADSNINGDDCGGDCAGEPANALDAPDGAAADQTTFVSLGDGGSITLNFTDNTCLVDPFDDDVTVYEVGDGEGGVDERYDIQVGRTGVGLAGDVFSGLGDSDFDVAATGLAGFNRIMITDTDGDDQAEAVTRGADIDAVECLDSLAFGTAHITKDFAPDTDTTIEIGTSEQQENFGFVIEISNPDGADLTGVILKDNVPGEFDIPDENAQDPFVPAVIMSSDDIACPVALLGEVTKGKGNGNQKLAPDFIQIGPLDDLGAGDTCTITVTGISTDDDHPGRGRNPTWTPTSCPETGFITLNDGVQVFLDASLDGEPDSDELLFRDDDSLGLECVFPD